METWKPVPHYEGLYEVSDQGRVRSCDRMARNTQTSYRLIPSQIIAPYVRPTGYMTVKLAKNGRKINRYVHRLVAQAFISECPEGHEACHRDGIKSHNTPENLYWGTRKQNIADNMRHGKHPHGEAHGMSKLTESDVIAIRSDSRSLKEIAADYPVSVRMIRQIKTRLNWKHV